MKMTHVQTRLVGIQTNFLAVRGVQLCYQRCMLLRVGCPNRLVVVELNLDFKFDRRLTTIQIPTILIESMIAILI